MFKVTVTYVVHNADGSVEIKKDSYINRKYINFCAILGGYKEQNILEIHIGKEKE